MAKAAKEEPVYAMTEKTPDHVRKIYRHLRSGHPHIQVRPKDQAPPGGDDGYSSSDACVEARAPKHRRDKRGRRRNVPSDFYSMYEEDDLVRMPMWKSYLYHLQQQAPKPKKIVCQREVANKPPFYGREFHGAMSREDADFLLTIGGEGSFLIRESQRAPGQYTLAIRFQDVTKNFKLYYDGQHYVGEKRFDNVQDLVADGLITFYLESKAADYIAALSAESNYAESPYVAYNTFKKRQLAHPSRRTRSRHAHTNAKSQPVAGPSGVAAAGPSVGQTSRSGSSGRESGRESGNSSSGSGGAGGGGGAGGLPAASAAAAVAPSAAVPKSSRANIPVSSQFVEKRRSQAETSANQPATSTPQGAAPAGAAAAVIPATQAESRPTSQTPLSKHSQATNAGASATYQQVIVVTQAPIAAPTVVSASNANANITAASQPYYQNSEQIALYQQQMQQQQKQQKQQKQQQQGDSSLQCQIPPPPEEPAPRPPVAGPSHGPPTTMAPTAPPSVSQPANIPSAISGEAVVTTAITDNGVSGVDGKVSHSTNTEGPPKPPLPTPLPEIRPKRHSAVPLSRQSSSRSPSPRSRVRDSKKTHSFKMFENFSTPPSSPPPHPHLGGEIKLSSVSWCNDFLEVMGCEKPHNFKLHTFKGPHWCDYCANFLWGLIAQGVKCQDCGLNAHKKCSERVPNDCMPDMKYVKRMFGIDLTTLVKAQNTLIPAVVEMCVKEIESRGLDSEGLYRVAGFHDDVEAIKMSFDKDIEQTDISEDHYDDINTITSVLKLYFRLLPIPLVTFEIYFRVIDTVRREDINLDLKLDKLKHMLAQLPPAHYHTLKYLMSHLYRVTELQSKNMMNAENLAIVFAPTALRSPETDPLSSLTAVKYERELIEVMINHHATLFD